MLTRNFDSYNSYLAVTPDDFRTLVTTNHKKAWALFIGTGGHVSVKGSDGNSVTFKNVPSGTLLPIHVVEINANGTTAQDIVALFSIPRT